MVLGSSGSGGGGGGSSSSSTASSAPPSLTGQRALLSLPGRSSLLLPTRTVENYAVPEHLLLLPSSPPSSSSTGPGGGGTTPHFDVGSGAGIAVWKVNKSGKLQSRRLALTADRRNLVVSSHKITNLRGLFSRIGIGKKRSHFGSGGGVAAEPSSGGGGSGGAIASHVIPIESIDRVQVGASTHRFVLARHAAEAQLQQQQQQNQQTSQQPSQGRQSQAAGHQTSTHPNRVSLYQPSSTTASSNSGSLDPALLLKLLGGGGSSSSSSSTSCVSVVYQTLVDSSSASAAPVVLETLDLVIPDFTEHETLVQCLEDLLHLSLEERIRGCSQLQRLRWEWTVALAKPLNDGMREGEFLALCDRRQIPLKRGVLSILFKEELLQRSTTEAQASTSTTTTVARSGRVKSRITVLTSNLAGSPPTASHKEHHHHHHQQLPVEGRLSFAGVAGLLDSIAKTSTAAQPGDHPTLDQLWQELLETDPVPPVKVSAATAISLAPSKEGGDGQDETSALEMRIPSEESISPLAFLSFLRSTQKEFSTSLEQATHLVRVMNSIVTLEDMSNSSSASSSAAVSLSSSSSSQNQHFQQDRLTKSQFFEYLACDDNDLLSPQKGWTGSDDMTRPLSHYWICTSHDTYLDRLPPSFTKSQFQQFTHNYRPPALSSPSPSALTAAAGTTPGGVTGANTNSGTASPSASASSPSPSKQWSVQEQPYMAALLRGVRCLEIDVYDGLDGKEPVVARWQPTSPNDRRISLAIVLRVVAAFLDMHPHSYPVILRVENHANSPAVHQRIAQLLSEVLGDRIAKPPLDQQHLDASLSPARPLPSPESLRGKVVVIGKRPRRIAPGFKVCRDDYDADNDSFYQMEKTRELTLASSSGIGPSKDDDGDDYYFDSDSSARVVVGFSATGPVRAGSSEPGIVLRSPTELLETAVNDYRRAAGEAEQLSDRVREREAAAEEAEARAARFTHLSGWTPEAVKNRALRIRQRGAVGSGEGDTGGDLYEEEKSTKDEGLEVHEVLPEFVEGSRDRYEQAAREAMEGAGREAQCHALVKEKETALRMARENLKMAQEREASMAETAKKARNEALASQEHAEQARERVLKVRELLKNCKDQTSTAGTVVQTALTEAKISEKRAADAEARARRAQQAADVERKRADDETKKEELLEQQVNDLHDDCMNATEATREAKERLEKAAAMLDRVKEQLKIIETSSQYRTELQAKSSKSEPSPIPRGGSFLAKHATKLDEREMCRELIREASEEAASAEAHRKEMQRAFEDRAYQWRVQADVAAQARRTADRSLHVAEELQEQAEEEREAANLRHTARQRAEATVENKGSYRSSLEAQLVEAEKAAAEAANVALQSKKRAEHLAREAERAKDHSRFQKVVEDLEWERNLAKQEYDAARSERERKDRVMAEEKRRLDTNAEVCKEATREAAVETDRTREEQHYQREAVTAYSEALAIRQEASDALDQLHSLKAKSKTKKMAVERAKEYKAKMDMMVELPLDLARLTLLHSVKYLNWSRSLSLSNAQVHSFAHNVLLLMLDKNPEEEKRNLHAFSKSHLCRVFPSWKALQNKNFTNYDPVFAWSLGCQMVASNLHSADESLLVADGRFRQNGSCGYVLKPPYLLDNVSKTESDQRWSLQIICGRNLPRPSRKVSGFASPMVKISVYSGSHKETRISYRTRPARHVGLNPVWTTSNKFELTIPIPSVSMVAFSVWHVMDDGEEVFTGASALPASCLREGFRSVALFDENHTRMGEHRNACLLVRMARR